MAVITEEQRKMKWSEILCQFIDPRDHKKSDGTLHRNNRKYWQPTLVRLFGSEIYNDLLSLWSKALFDSFIDNERSGGAWTGFFQSVAEPLGIRQLIGKDIRGDVDMVDTWLWGSAEKTLFYPVSVDCTDAEAVSYLSKDDSGVPTYELPIDTIGFGDTTKSLVVDKTVLIEPRRNKTVEASKIIGV